MLHPLRLALLINLCVISVASAQTIPEGAEDFSGFGRGRTIIVADDAGVETAGRLRRFTTNELTIIVDGKDRTFTRLQVTAIFVQGDSLKNGMVIGLLTGAAIGAAVANRSTCGDFWAGVRPCSRNEQVTHTMVAGAVIGAVGAGIGIGIDALIPGRRLIYEKLTSARAAISIVPSLAPSRVGLLTSVSW